MNKHSQTLHITVKIVTKNANAWNVIGINYYIDSLRDKT